MDDETEDLAQRVIGAAIEVHSRLGAGLPESAYKLALSYELELRGIPHEKEARVPICYKGREVGVGCVDILVGGKLVLELKVVEALHEVHRAQALSYLRALKLKLAVLINFNALYLKDGIRRVINTH